VVIAPPIPTVGIASSSAMTPGTVTRSVGAPIASVARAPAAYPAARRAGAQVLLVGDGVPDADSHVPRIADFTGITFTIH